MPISPITIRFQKPSIQSFKSKVVWEANNKESSQELKDLIDEFEENPHKFQRLGNGKCSEVYALKPYEIIIKRPYKTKPNFDDFRQEGEALQKIPTTFSNSQQYITRVRTKNNKHYLVSTFRPGQGINYEKNPLTPEYLRLLMNSLLELDKAHIYHFDLSNNNILLCDAGANIIDYQWAKTFEPFSARYENSQKGIHFPNEIIPSNIQNYEISGFSSYIYRLNQKYGKDYTRDFIKNYIKAKSRYHEERYDHFKQLAKEQGIYLINTPKTPNTHNKEVYNPLKYEKALEKVYKKPTDDVIDIEIMRTEFLRADKKAFYFNDPNNADEKLNTFNAIPYLANSILAGRNFQFKLDEFAEKYKDDKYMSRYIEYNKKIVNHALSNFCSWNYSNIEFFKELAQDTFRIPLDRKIDYKENKIKYFEKFKTLEPILTSSLRRINYKENPLEIFTYEERKNHFKKMKDCTNNLANLTDLKYYTRVKDKKTTYYEMVKDIQLGISRMQLKLNEDSPIDAFCLMFTTLTIVSELKRSAYYSKNKNNLFYQTYNNLEVIENELLEMINKTRTGLLNSKNSTIPNYNFNDFRLTIVPTYENNPETEKKNLSFLEKIWLKIEKELF